jgi:hypothetical protein
MMGCECRAAPKGVGTASTYEKSRQGGRNIGRVKTQTSFVVFVAVGVERCCLLRAAEMPAVSERCHDMGRAHLLFQTLL